MPLVDFGYAANGVNTVGLTIITNEETLKSNPDLVRRFVKATMRSFQAALKEPEASIKAGQKVKADMDADLAMAQLKAGIGLMASEATKSLPMGQFALKDWQDTVDLMKQYQDLADRQGGRRLLHQRVRGQERIVRPRRHGREDHRCWLAKERS